MRISDWSSDVCSSNLAEDDVGDRVETADGQVLRAADEVAGGVVHQPRQRAPVGSDRVDHVGDGLRHADVAELGRASCRERVCQYVEITVVAVSFRKTQIATTNLNAK